MGRLRRIGGDHGEPHEVELCHYRMSVGRGDSNRIVVRNQATSEFHGFVEWRNTGWYVQDRASENGTSIVEPWLDDPLPRVVRNGAARLHLNEIVRFGTLDGGFQLVDESGPIPVAMPRRSSRSPIRGEVGLLEFPESRAGIPTVRLTLSPLRWVFALNERTEPCEVRSGVEIQVGGETWLLELPVPAEGTHRVSLHPAIESSFFDFTRRGARVGLVIETVAHGQIVLPPRRVYCALFELACAAKSDARSDNGREGWRTSSELADAVTVRFGEAPINISNWLWHLRSADRAGFTFENNVGLFETVDGRHRLAAPVANLMIRDR